ncbi:MAG: TraB/GumN family protein [Burkholderiaceae bacterium]|nr:TraB/GumN family protein [Burkholderiaceae bacterium]
MNLCAVALRALCAAAALAAVAIPPSRAQSPNAEVARKADAAAARGFAWEATKNGRRVLLVGTIHVGRAAPPPPDCSHRFAQAAVIAFEADVFDAQKVGQLVQKLATYPSHEPDLKSRLPAPLRERVEALLARYGLDSPAIWRMKPWMLANTLVVVEAARLGFNPAYATEAMLYQLARTCGKAIVEIEGVERQLAIFDGTSQNLQLAYLEQAVKGIESGESEREVRRLVEAWERRDAADIERMLAAMRESGGAAERFVVGQIIDGRHPTMVEAIDRYAASDKLHLVAVGSLHYFGPNGLLALLRARGYTIKPLD